MTHYRLILYILPVLLLLSLDFKGQSKKKQVQKTAKPKTYTREEVVDSLQGIVMYDVYIASLGIDSVRRAKDGKPLQGWQEDFYSNGKTLHKGLYKDGHLELFRNFHDNGATERVFAKLDSASCNVEVYYPNGNQRKQVNYFNGKVKRRSEFYENGLLKITEEFDVNKNILIMQKTWFPGGQIQSEILRDAKTGKYSQKTYYINSKLFEQGLLVQDKESGELLRTGAWISLDSTGKNKKTTQYKITKKAAN
ncbi:MAG TPA: hypothetical protein PLQ93_08075 [Bacteroidia bacterium]|nr:hypothetical protein [Bacteroidia bacterium]